MLLQNEFTVGGSRQCNQVITRGVLRGTTEVGRRAETVEARRYDRGEPSSMFECGGLAGLAGQHSSGAAGTKQETGSTRSLQ